MFALRLQQPEQTHRTPDSCPACLPALQLSNPLHMLQLWDPEVRLQCRCSARQSAVTAERVKRMRQHPPEPHTIAGAPPVLRQLTSLLTDFANIANHMVWVFPSTKLFS